MASGNPLTFSSIEDVVAKRARITLWPKGAGFQLVRLGHG